MVTISVLGPPLVIRDTGVLQFGRKKTLALLIFLALTREWHSRDYLATLFWPQQGQTEARASLRRALSLIQSLTGEALLSSEADRIMLSPEAEVSVDAQVVHTTAAACMAKQAAGAPPPAASPPDGEDTLDLYRGEFLKGFTLPDCSDFTEWQLRQAENLRADAIILFDARIDELRASGNTAAAIGLARRRLEIDPFDESAHRNLMSLYADAGETSLALHQFERCADILRWEFDSEPEREPEDTDGTGAR